MGPAPSGTPGPPHSPYFIFLHWGSELWSLETGVPWLYAPEGKASRQAKLIPAIPADFRKFLRLFFIGVIINFLAIEGQQNYKVSGSLISGKT
jgi:hypothetical protein